MKLKRRSLYIFSLTLNLIFIILALVFIVQKTGIIDLVVEKIFEENPVIVEQKIPRKKLALNTSYNIYYELKVSQFRLLASAEKEIIFLGDSLTDRAEWAELLNNSSIKNRGIGSDTTDGILRRLDEVVESNPQKIFILIGINDILRKHKTAAEIIKNYQKILSYLQKQTPETQVYIQSILPINNHKYKIKLDNNKLIILNSRLEKIAKKFGYTYIDLYFHFVSDRNQLNPQYTLDGIHLNGRGYLVWKQVIEKYIN